MEFDRDLIELLIQDFLQKWRPECYHDAYGVYLNFLSHYKISCNSVLGKQVDRMILSILDQLVLEDFLIRYEPRQYEVLYRVKEI